LGPNHRPLETVVERLLEHARGERAILQRHGGERCQGSEQGLDQAGTTCARASMIITVLRGTEG
jgi:hypothetical protein